MDLVTVDFAKREGYIVLEQLTSYCSLFFFVFWTSIYSWLVQIKASSEYWKLCDKRTEIWLLSNMGALIGH